MRRSSLPFVFAAGLSVGIAGAALWGRVSSGRAVEARVDEPRDGDEGDQAPARAATSAARSAAGPSGEDLREQIRRSVAAVLAEQRRGQALDALLDELEDQARKQGKVTALEVQTGLAALDAAYSDDPDKGAAFARRMESLSRELEAHDATPAPEAARVPVLAHLQAIESAAPGPARDRMTRDALAAIDSLPVEEQDQARLGLDRATAKGAENPAPADPDRILADLRQVRDGAARRDLVEAFMRATTGLPLEEQERRFRELDAATADPPSLR